MKNLTVFIFFFCFGNIFSQDTLSIDKFKQFVNGYKILNDNGSIDYIKYSVSKNKIVSTETYRFNISYKFEPEVFAQENESSDTINFEKAGTLDGKRVFADYPQVAVDNDIDGKVIVRFIVETNGELTNLAIDKGAHPLLDNACIEALSNVKFKPASKDGKPIRVSVRYPFSFKMM